MESVDSLSSKKDTFVKHVFRFDDAAKGELLNVVQYAVLAVLPVVLVNKAMQRYVPDADDTKGSLELLMEVLLQVVVMFVALIFIHRLVTFVPTYSGDKYPDFHVTSVVLAMLTIVLSLQTKLGEKVSILFDRAVQLWEGKTGGSKQARQQQQQQQQYAQPQQQAQGMSMSGAVSLSQLPTQSGMGGSAPNFDAMYQSQPNPMPGAATPGMEGFDNAGPMAANAMGSGPFGSAFGW